MKGIRNLQDRIIDFRRVRAGDLKEDVRNWRRHPDSQRQALTAMLDRIGYADALLTREEEDGTLVVVDGHLRKSLDDDAIVPVLVTDLTREEAGEVIATLDPLASMAEVDSDALQALLDDMPSIDTILDGFLQDLVDDNTWIYDREQVENTRTEDAGLFTTWKIRCPADQADSLKPRIEKFLDKLGLELT